MKILLVEDDENIAESINLCLKLYLPEAILKIAAKGIRALTCLKDEMYDVVLIDLGLPDINGFEVLKNLRQFSNTPAIIISARSDEETVSMAYACGANSYIAKPFKHTVLIGHLEAVKSGFRSL